MVAGPSGVVRRSGPAPLGVLPGIVGAGPRNLLALLVGGSLATGAFCQGSRPCQLALLVGLLSLATAIAFVLGFVADALPVAWLCDFCRRAWLRASYLETRVTLYRRGSPLELLRRRGPRSFCGWTRSGSRARRPGQPYPAFPEHRRRASARVRSRASQLLAGGPSPLSQVVDE